MNNAEAIFQLEISIVALKILRALFSHGHTEPNKDVAPASTFFASTLNRLKQIQQMRLHILSLGESSPQKHPRISELLVKHVLGIGKLCTDEGKRPLAANNVFDVYWSICQDAAATYHNSSLDIQGVSISDTLAAVNFSLMSRLFSLDRRKPEALSLKIHRTKLDYSTQNYRNVAFI